MSRYGLDCHGRHGSAAPHGSTPPRLSKSDVRALADGALVVVTWSGGNGPHLYQICADIVHPHDRHIREPFMVTRDEVVDEGGYVSLPVAG